MNLHVHREQRLMGGPGQLPAVKYWNTSDLGSAWKARVVIQGFKEDKEELDGPGFIYSCGWLKCGWAGGFETPAGVYLTMENYVGAMMVKLDLEPSHFPKVRSPISAEIKDDTPCNKVEATLFMMGTGMLGWLAFTGRPDLKYSMRTLEFRSIWQNLRWERFRLCITVSATAGSQRAFVCISQEGVACVQKTGSSCVIQTSLKTQKRTTIGGRKWGY